MFVKLTTTMMMMASSSGTCYKEEEEEGISNKQRNGNGCNGGEWGVPTFQHQQTISMDWTPDEQSMLEDGLSKSVFDFICLIRRSA